MPQLRVRPVSQVRLIKKFILIVYLAFRYVSKQSHQTLSSLKHPQHPIQGFLLTLTAQVLILTVHNISLENSCANKNPVLT